MLVLEYLALAGFFIVIGVAGVEAVRAERLKNPEAFAAAHGDASPPAEND